MNRVKHELFQEFQEVEVALEKARGEELPTYAPGLFAKAVELYKKAQQDWQRCEPIEQIREQLQLAVETLVEAKDVSKVSKESLSQVVETRIQFNQNELARYHSPGKLNEAEGHYREAIRQAEAGDIGAASKSAATAQNSYREATLQALERGPIRNLENQLEYYSKYLPRKRQEEAARELSSLKSALNRARTGELEIPALRARIAGGGVEIGQQLALDTGFGLESDLIPYGVRDLHPDTFSPPRAPVNMGFSERTANSLTVWWKDNFAFEDVNQLERREGDGPWELVEEWGPLSGWQYYTDVGLEPDTHYCYRVRVENSFGANVTPWEKWACGYTRDGNDRRVWRVQLTIRTADVSSAGTSNAVQVSLNGPLSVNRTWLDYGPRRQPTFPMQWIDDFDRGSEFTYDLSLRTISELSDISMIWIEKEGTDAWAIAELSLKVNGVEVFERFFGNTAETALWIGDGHSPTYTIFHSELRTHESWQSFIDSTAILPLQISNEEIVSRLESMIGDRIHGNELYWGKLKGSEWVTATRANENTLHVDADLAAEVWGLNPEIDIDFDLNFNIECDMDAGTATLMVATSNFVPDPNFSILADILTLGIVEFFDDDIEDRIEDSWRPITEQFEIPTGGLCPRVEVDEDGNINFILT